MSKTKTHRYSTFTWFVLAILLFSYSSIHASEYKHQTSRQVGSVIFIHPDGSGLNLWDAARMYWKGPDKALNWDKLPEMAIYRGHLLDRLASTSNGGATTHGFGYKVMGPDSYGMDKGRSILSLSGYAGSIMREAANKGYPVGIVNDGDASEPGTGGFLAEVTNRKNANEIVRQLLEGRPNTTDKAPVVILGGGERFFLPESTPLCTTSVTPECAVHIDPVNGKGPNRKDGRNLVKEAIAKGWIVLRTRDEFETLQTKLTADKNYAPNVLGLFAADDLFNDEPEEALIQAGLVDNTIPEGSKKGRLILWGDVPGSLGYNPPTSAEMTEMAITILDRRRRAADKPFLLVSEVESTDNMPNDNNGIGALCALKRADDVIGVAKNYQKLNDNTLIITGADSDAGGIQVVSPPKVDSLGRVTDVKGNPTGDPMDEIRYPLDGIEGRKTVPFTAEPDDFGNAITFALAWSGRPDVAGAIVSRATGFNSAFLRSKFSTRFDNTDIYRMMYVTLFGKWLPDAYGKKAPTRQ